MTRSWLPCLGRSTATRMVLMALTGLLVEAWSPACASDQPGAFPEHGIAALAVQEERYDSFASPKAEYTFEYPRGWIVADHLGEQEPGVAIVAPDKQSKRLSALLMVYRYERTARVRSLDGMAQELTELARRGEARLLETRMTELDGSPCRIVALTRTWSQPVRQNGIEIQELPVVERYLVIERGGRFYVVTYVTSQEFAARFGSVFEHVTRTFHFRSTQP